MSSQLHSRIHQEVELIQRFAGSYGKKFDDLIARLNGDAPVPTADGQCLRLCVEAVNMVLSLQGQLAKVLDDLSKETSISSPVVPPVAVVELSRNSGRAASFSNLAEPCLRA
jgi:hypothetical protein